MRTRIKICGIKSPEDAVVAIESGADAIGLVFYEPSARHVDLETAGRVRARLPALVHSVGVFVDPSESYVREVLAQAGLSVLQFHGSESRDFCEQFELPYIKAIPMSESVDLKTLTGLHPQASAFLLDTYSAAQAGGSGKAFDWQRAKVRLPAPVLLAGGLSPSNVHRALTDALPWGVDVSSGVESSPGVKNQSKIKAFCHAVQLWDQTVRDTQQDSA
ncbi:MAG: phosphoribosylanthranilate isomerase [Gammaproteobacteria bacterium]|nr:phosphoribosylanthranilate isomerase [Gammaproteobacteria bacterium]